MCRTRISSLFGKITVVLIVSCFSLSAQGKYGGGTGEPNDPYQIRDANHMQAIGADANDWDKHFLLCADIDLSGYIGTEFNIIHYFRGVFDGNDLTISNFTYDSNGVDRIGLFGNVYSEIKNLGLIDPNVDAGTGRYVGSLVGWLSGGTITNCYVQGGSISGGGSIGGLVGINMLGTIQSCHATASVRGTAEQNHSPCIGGLVGENWRATIANCYATSSVSGDEAIGGLVGENYYNTTITNCYATGTVSGTTYVGGLVGTNSGPINNCYSVGSVDGNDLVGGLVGSGLADNVSNSFWDTETSGQPTSAGGTPKTTAEMQTESTFTDAGWDFVGEFQNGPSDEWAQPPGGGYMLLWWQLSPLPALPSFSGGTGTSDDPYLISSPEDLNRIGHNSRLMGAHFKLINDIDLSSIHFFIISSRPFPFTGIFDGNSHTISNFTYESISTDNIGLFRYVDDPNAEIRNLGLINPYVDAETERFVGSLVGWLRDGTISNCYVESSSVSGYDYVGGLVGRNGWCELSCDGGTITNCYSTGSVSGYSSVGGLVGSNSGPINNCYSTNSVSGNYEVGGLVAQNDGTISNCYSTGKISGYMGVGGLVGKNWGIMLNCYSTGDVTGEYDVGGLVGFNEFGNVSNCYSTGSVVGDYDVGGLIGYDRAGCSYTACFWDSDVNPGLAGVGNITDPADVIGTPTTEMQTISTFTDAGWDFSTPVWKMNCEGMSYPKLSWWQPVLGDFGCPDGVDFIDFAVLAAQWRLPPAEPSADIAPNGGDNIVDRFDLAAMADNWLSCF